jgi:hypothetical protein
MTAAALVMRRLLTPATTPGRGDFRVLHLLHQRRLCAIRRPAAFGLVPELSVYEKVLLLVLFR